jgi:anthranilate synthase component 1
MTTAIATDLLTPLGAYLRLRNEGRGSFLLESVEHGRLGRHSFVGAGTRLVYLNEAEALGLPVVGYVGYDHIAKLEPTVSLPDDGPDLPESRFVVADTLIRFDHVSGVADVLYGNADAFAAPQPSVPRGGGKRGPLRRFPEQAEHERRVLRAKGTSARAMRSRPSSRSAERPRPGIGPGALPRAAAINPSPYSSARARRPRADRLVAGDRRQVQGARAEVNPIAGSIAPGDGDAEALPSSKGSRGHVMLVDLGRNDLSRVQAGHRARRALPRAGAVLAHHAPRLRGGRGAARRRHSVRSPARVLPSGTASGRRDPRDADHLELEEYRRGIYGGAVGYALPGGALDTCIAIRTIVLRDGIAHLQAGAGIVADSDPTAEHEECLRKLAAVEAAIDLAEADQR